jgi:crotonobetainyl-CoA:carnitine CoA-transferase CaiB-like acyl-CoA transferase
MARAFEGIRVLDLTHVLAGPFCAYQLAVLGADVIKIEPPGEPDCARGRGPDADQNAALRGLNYQVQAGNKRAMTLDLKKSDGQAILRELAAGADVLIENYRTGALGRLGLGPDELRAVNPALIYCSMTGFGGAGPKAATAAYDNVIQATAGIVDRTGGRKPGLSFVDYSAGMNAAFAISAALFQRQRDGLGQHIDCSMLETAMIMMAPEMAAELHPVKSSRGKEAGIRSYHTADGELMLGIFTPAQNRRFWALLADEGVDAGKLGETEDWESLWNKADEMHEKLTAIMPSRNAADWQEWLEDNGFAAEVIRPLSEAAADPQLRARPFLHAHEAGPGDVTAPVTAPVAAFAFSHDGPRIDRRPPGFGEHTDEVLRSLGRNADDIEALRAAGVI